MKIFLAFLLTRLILILKVQAELVCQGNRGGIADNSSSLEVQHMIDHLVNKIKHNTTYQDGVSFTCSSTHTNRNFTTVARLLVWDIERCAPGTDATLKSASDLVGSFNDLIFNWNGYHEFYGFGWATVVKQNYILDYYTIQKDVDRSTKVDFTSKDRVGRYCTEWLDPPASQNCNPRKSNLISGTNGVFNILRGSERLVSPNKLYYVEMQADCNLVVYKNVYNMTTPVWATGTYKQGVNCYAALEPNLNLVLYTVSNSSRPVLWSSNPTSKFAKNATFTLDSPATGVLTMQNDGNLVIYATDQVVDPIWASGTSS